MEARAAEPLRHCRAKVGGGGQVRWASPALAPGAFGHWEPQSPGQTVSGTWVLRQLGSAGPSGRHPPHRRKPPAQAASTAGTKPLSSWRLQSRVQGRRPVPAGPSSATGGILSLAALAVPGSASSPSREPSRRIRPNDPFYLLASVKAVSRDSCPLGCWGQDDDLHLGAEHAMAVVSWP